MRLSSRKCRNLFQIWKSFSIIFIRRILCLRNIFNHQRHKRKFKNQNWKVQKRNYTIFSFWTFEKLKIQEKLLCLLWFIKAYGISSIIIYQLSIMYRIISGKWKAKKIAAPKNFEVRPTTDFAKEALFSMLEHRFDLEFCSVWTFSQALAPSLWNLLPEIAKISLPSNSILNTQVLSIQPRRNWEWDCKWTRWDLMFLTGWKERKITKKNTILFSLTPLSKQTKKNTTNWLI